MNKIKELRMSRGLTQKELANMLKVKRTTVTMWENGESFPHTDRLLPLAKILNTSVAVLLESKHNDGD